MAEINWINFLHFYQPPLQQKEILNEIVNSSYLFIVNVLKNNPDLKLTININASLIEQLKTNNFNGLIEDIKRLYNNRQIEIVGTAAYHPILPLLPKHEIIHQINIQNKTLKEIFGDNFAAKGFFSPEMAINKKTAKIIKDLGFEWVIVDQISADKPINPLKKYIDKDSGLFVVFRDRTLSEMYPPFAIKNLLETDIEKDIEDVITATDAELYGHHHIDKDNIFDQLAKDKRVKTVLISDYLKSLKEDQRIKLRECSWSTTEQDLEEKNPFPLWKDKDNKIHSKIWKLAYKALELVNDYSDDKNIKWARRHLNNGLASCTFWWCSKKQPSPFCPITWNPDEVEKGVRELIKSIRSLESAPKDDKKAGEKIFGEINKLIWQEHWK